MRKLLMLAVLVAVLAPGGSSFAAAKEGPIPVDPPPFIVIHGTLVKLKAPTSDHAGWIKVKVVSATDLSLVSKKVEFKLSADSAITYDAGSQAVPGESVTVWVPRLAKGHVASSVEVGS